MKTTLPLPLKNELDQLLTIAKHSTSLLINNLDDLKASTDIVYCAVLALDQLLALEKKLALEYQ